MATFWAAVPEAAIHENRDPVAVKEEIGTAWKIWM
jgi:hypothetical protein